MDKLKKDILTGALVGLIVCLLGTTAYILVMFSDIKITEAYENLYYSGLLPKVITLGTLPNVLVFHLFVKRNEVYKARGVLMAVVLLAIVFAVLKFV